MGVFRLVFEQFCPVFKPKSVKIQGLKSFLEWYTILFNICCLNTFIKYSFILSTYNRCLLTIL